MKQNYLFPKVES